MPLVIPHSLDPWTWLRSNDFTSLGKEIVRQSAPAGEEVMSVEHVRTGHYAAYRVTTTSGKYLVRVGLISPSDTLAPDNSDFMNTSRFSPTGQAREYALAQEMASQGVSVAVPSHYTTLRSLDAEETFDALWLPFLQDEGRPVTANEWHKALTPLHNAIFSVPLPVFTNRAKTVARLNQFGNRGTAEALLKEYDDGVSRLFEVATQWGPVHGDAHSGNILISAGQPVIFDFDTVCWAPTVWDLTHLLFRVGTDGNTGYTAGELREVFGFTEEEMDVALHLRSIASKIARAFSQAKKR